MKTTIFTLFSALILAQGITAHAEGIFANAFRSKLNKAPAADIKLVAMETTSATPVADGQTQVDPNVQQVSYCEDSCCEASCDSWFNNEMCPGTGAYGGDSRFSATIGFNQDTFFGNYTTAAAGYAINERVDATFYSILWHTDFFSQSGLGAVDGIQGTGLWTEFGGGLNFKFLDGALNVNPQFGILNGALLSSGAAGVVNEPAVFDGVVPNLTVNYGDSLIQSQLYAGYYIGTRGVDQNDFIHWWYNAGVSPWGECNNWLSTLSAGVHYEMLAQTAPGTADNLYQWLGPYMQVALPNGFTMRYSAGANIDDGAGLGDNFYKVNLGYSF